jgi:ribosomal protein S25
VIYRMAGNCGKKKRTEKRSEGKQEKARKLLESTRKENGRNIWTISEFRFDRVG